MASVSLLALSLTASSAGAGEATAEDLATAKVLFQQGSSLVDAGRYEEACPKLEAARRLVRGIGVTLYLGECYEQTGRLVSAWEQFDEARRMAEDRHDRRADLAGARAGKLWPRLPKLTVVVTPSADVPGLVVTDDGVLVDHEAYNVGRQAEPRTHRVRALAPNREPWETSVDVPASAATIRVEVPPLANASNAPAPSTAGGPLPRAPQPAETPEVTTSPLDPRGANPTTEVRSGRPSAQRIAGIVVVGVGVASLAAGALAGLEAKSQMDDSNAGGHCQPNNHCDATGLAERSSALTWATWSTVGVIGGVACVAAGATLYLTAPDDRPPGIAVVVRPWNRGGAIAVQGGW